MPIPTQADPHLLRFTKEGITSEEQKRALKKAGFIEYTHGFWHLSADGKARAIRLGYLAPRSD
jgi:hypothetical protein